VALGPRCACARRRLLDVRDGLRRRPRPRRPRPVRELRPVPGDRAYSLHRPRTEHFREARLLRRLRLGESARAAGRVSRPRALGERHARRRRGDGRLGTDLWPVHLEAGAPGTAVTGLGGTPIQKPARGSVRPTSALAPTTVPSGYCRRSGNRAAARRRNDSATRAVAMLRGPRGTRDTDGHSAESTAGPTFSVAPVALMVTESPSRAEPRSVEARPVPVVPTASHPGSGSTWRPSAAPREPPSGAAEGSQRRPWSACR